MTTIEDFHKLHPFTLADGRRFTSFACAAHSVLTADAGRTLLPITDQRTGSIFNMYDCQLVYDPAGAAVSIGNGLYARQRTRETFFGAYLRRQATCPHQKRDPLGTCYRCGHKQKETA